MHPEGHPRLIEIRLGEALIARRRGDPATAARLLDEARSRAAQDLDPRHMLFEAIALGAGAACPPAPAFSRLFASLRVCRAIIAAPLAEFGNQP